MTPGVIAVLGVLGGSGFATIVGLVARRKVTKAETVDKVVEAAEKVLKNFMADNDALRAEVTELKNQNRDQARQIGILTEQLRRMAYALRRSGVDPDLAAEGEQ